MKDQPVARILKPHQRGVGDRIRESLAVLRTAESIEGGLDHQGRTLNLPKALTGVMVKDRSELTTTGASSDHPSMHVFGALGEHLSA